MSKRKVPATSRAAYEAIKEKIPNHYDRIIKALQVLGISNYEGIGAKALMDKHAINRRLKEMREMTPPMVVKLETKSLTKSGNMAHNYVLSEHYTLKIEHPATQLINSTNEAQEFLNELQSERQSPKQQSVQANLF